MKNMYLCILDYSHMTHMGNMRSGSRTVNREAVHPTLCFTGCSQHRCCCLQKKLLLKKTRAQVVINPAGSASLPWHVRWRQDVKWNLRFAGFWESEMEVLQSLCGMCGLLSVKALCFLLPVQGFDPFLVYGARRAGWSLGVHQHHSVLIKQSLCFLSIHCLNNMCIPESSEGSFPLSFHRSTKMWDLNLRTVSWVQCQWITLNKPILKLLMAISIGNTELHFTVAISFKEKIHLFLGSVK